MQFFGGSEISPTSPAPTSPGNNAHMIYVFNRNGVCLLYREWNRPLRTLSTQQDHKLMFGLLFSLRSFTAKMDPTGVVKGNLGVPQLPGQGCSFHSFRTNTFKLSFMESPSGIKIILVTHPTIGDLRESLKYIYNLYVEYVVKNPLYTPGTPIGYQVLDDEKRGRRLICKEEVFFSWLNVSSIINGVTVVSPLPGVVAVSKLLPSKGFGRAGVSAEEAEARESDCVSILVSPSITGCSSSRSHKGGFLGLSYSSVYAVLLVYVVLYLITWIH
ncbi:hypothetical protein HHK36_029044 [Tetracentron sinense]|uniref:Trafficking protein particle complex subunit n=1 Tax=Tetracentron sinense TaxID=13715 RepID=A0A835D416_TETSI|nr:hypothetical protein HHK36_029044 [Tetracentron sinense]